MNRSRLDRALYGPSLFEVTLGALLSVSLGLLLGFLFLVLKPVTVLKDSPKEDERDPSMVYYVTGSADSSKARQTPTKIKRLVEGTPGELSFTEDDLNVWLSSQGPKKVEKKRTPPPKPGAKGAPPPDEPVPDELLTLEVPNVRIRDGVFQVGIPGSLNLISFSIPVILQAQGDFVQGPEMWVFHPKTLYLGSMPLHRVPHFTEMLTNRIMRSNSLPEDALEAWKHVSQVAVEGRALKLTVAAQ